MSKIKKLLESFEPDFVLCTQAFPCGMVADYKKTCDKKIPLIGVLTDHAPHSYWLHEEVDFYIVPFEETARALERKEVPKSKIKVYGIPVDPKFALERNKAEIRENLGLNREEPVILVMGGSQGLGVVEEIAALLLEDSAHRHQLLVVTGSNKKLYTRLEKMNRKKSDSRMRLFAYVENIDELMDAADIIVTKPGGLTVAEALAKALPMMIVNPIPGHERMNTDFLVAKGAAVEIKDYACITGDINKLLDTGDALVEMKRNIKMLAKPDSARSVAKLALEA